MSKTKQKSYRTFSRSYIRKRREAERNGWQRKPTSWIDGIVKPMAKELAKLMPGMAFEIIGPTGIACDVLVMFYEEGKENGPRKRINFSPIDLEQGKVAVHDYAKAPEDFATGHIGEMNGLNYPFIPIPEEATAEWLLQYVY